MNKFKNPIFWVSLVSLVLASAGVDFETLTSWPLLLDALLSILKNPVSVVMCLVTAYGIFNDNSTKPLDKLTLKCYNKPTDTSCVGP